MAPVVSNPPETLVAGLQALSHDQLRGFRFFSRKRQEEFFSFAQLHAEAERRAAHLQRLGLAHGDRVALVLPEPKEFVLTFLGASVAGVVPVPISPRASFKNADGYVETVAHIVTTASARFVFCMEGNREVLEDVPAACGDSQTVLLNVEDAFADTPPAFAPAVITPEDLCFLQFTSGSTSKPKGVMVTHGNLVANASAFLGPGGLASTPDDHAITWLPLFHDMGLIGFVLGTIVCNLPTTLIPTETFARSPRIWLEMISQLKGTITYAPNFAYDLITKRVRERDLETLDLRTLRIAGCGAEPIRARTLLAFADKFAQCGFRSSAFLPSYGMAESTLAITFHQRDTEMIVDRVDADAMQAGRAKPAADDDDNALEVVSCGVPFPGHQLSIVDTDGNEVGEREVGEVLTRGPSVTAGYFENPEASAEAWRDGWLHTGDLGYRAEGNLYICGRIKDLIIIRGANHYPQDIEWAISDMEGVRRGNVVAFSSMRDGTEELVVAAEAHSSDAARLRDEIAKRITTEFGLATGHVAVVPVATLPKTSSGKAQRRKTKALFEAGDLPEHP